MNSDGCNPVPVTDGRYSAVAPDWSPDGRKIVYASRQNAEENGRYEIFVMNADGSNQTRLTINPNADDGAPRSSLDGTKIAFYSMRNNESHIYVMNVYVMNADGSQLMFVNRPDSSTNLEHYTINLHSTDLRRMTMTTGLLEDSSHWRP